MSDHRFLIPPGELPRVHRDAAVRRNATGDPERCAADQCDRLRALLSSPGARAAAATLRAEASASTAWMRSVLTPSATARHLTNAMTRAQLRDHLRVVHGVETHQGTHRDLLTRLHAESHGRLAWKHVHGSDGVARFPR